MGAKYVREQVVTTTLDQGSDDIQKALIHEQGVCLEPGIAPLIQFWRAALHSSEALEEIEQVIPQGVVVRDRTFQQQPIRSQITD